MCVSSFSDYVSTLLLAPMHTRVMADHHSLIPRWPQLVRSPTTVATENSFKNAVCLTEILVFMNKQWGEKQSSRNPILGKSQRDLACWRSFSSNGFKESSQRVVQFLTTLLDGYQMCTSHAWAAEGGVGMLSWLGPPTMCWWHHYLVIIHMNSMCLWEWTKLKIFGGSAEKNEDIRNILFVALTFCFVFAHYHFVHFVRLFIVLFCFIIIFTHES